MTIRVEFFGIARQRAGTSSIELETRGPLSLGMVLELVAERLPEFGRECLADGRLSKALAANVDGARFVSDPAIQLKSGQSLLILSADAGG